MSFYSFARKLFVAPTKFLLRMKVTGYENVPEEGGYLVCANHTSNHDVIALGVAFKRRLMFMAKKELFIFKPFGALLRKVGAFPVDRGSSDIGALKKSISFIKAGELLNVFPQGKRYVRKIPSETAVKSGVGMIASHTKCGVIPVFIKTKHNHVHLFGKTEIIIGKVIEYGDLGLESGGKEAYGHATRVIFSKLCALGGYDFPVEPEAPEGEEK